MESLRTKRLSAGINATESLFKVYRDLIGRAGGDIGQTVREDIRYGPKRLSPYYT